MIKNILFCALLISSTLFGQVNFETILSKDYSSLPVKIRIENSGIFGISTFDVDNGNVFLKSFDTDEVLVYKNNAFSRSGEAQTSDIAFDKDRLKVTLEKPLSESDGNLFARMKKVFIGDSQEILNDYEGELKGNSGASAQIEVKERNSFEIRYSLEGFNKNFSFSFPSNLAYADLIGIDSNGNSFLIVETYLSEIPLRVQREVMTISAEGKVLSRLLVPGIKYLSTIRDFVIDGEGNLYHMITEEKGLSVIKISGLTHESQKTVSYPVRYNYNLHYDNYTTTKEVSIAGTKGDAAAKGPGNTPVLMDRAAAVRTAESYVLHRYKCISSNIAYTAVTAPGGDLVRTPSWLVTGWNARVPYMWGGFNTLSEFDAGLAKGKFAGDIHTEGVSSYAVGVDCSGFVSRCWNLSYHSTTSDMPNITYQHTNWNNLKPGDILLKSGHVRLFIKKNSNGSYRVVEAAARNWDVSYWSFAPSDLANYEPRYYQNIKGQYSTKVVVLNEVRRTENDSVLISWSCDTSKVTGYRLYSSEDGINYKLVMNENQVKSNSVKSALNGKAYYFRVAAISNDGFSSESMWSNAMGALIKQDSSRALIVDAFNGGGSWQGVGHTFAVEYGQVLAKENVPFESVKNSVVKDSIIDLKAYSQVYWIVGDESTIDESVDSKEQALLIDYLKNGGSLFISGSEIGWDLSAKGTASDKDFYANYLKARFVEDNSTTKIVKGKDSTFLYSMLPFNMGQTYTEDFPDVIDANGGSRLCLLYNNGKGAGVSYSGTFGESVKTGNVIYFSFPLETIADDSVFNAIIRKVVNYFKGDITSVSTVNTVSEGFRLYDNFPNPFNASTVIRYHLQSESRVNISVYNLLGQKVAELFEGTQPQGTYNIPFDASSLASGIYFFSLKADGNSGGKNFISTKKMLLMK